MSSQTYTVTGMVLSAGTVGDYDKLGGLTDQRARKNQSICQRSQKAGKRLDGCGQMHLRSVNFRSTREGLPIL